jgi:hypothetical protein
MAGTVAIGLLADDLAAIEPADAARLPILRHYVADPGGAARRGARVAVRCIWRSVEPVSIGVMTSRSHVFTTPVVRELPRPRPTGGRGTW